jgi:hypothetical protein
VPRLAPLALHLALHPVIDGICLTLSTTIAPLAVLVVCSPDATALRLLPKPLHYPEASFASWFESRRFAGVGVERRRKAISRNINSIFINENLKISYRSAQWHPRKVLSSALSRRVAASSRRIRIAGGGRHLGSAAEEDLSEDIAPKWTDEEILADMRTGALPQYRLESETEDATRAVKLRRQWLQDERAAANGKGGAGYDCAEVASVAVDGDDFGPCSRIPHASFDHEHFYDQVLGTNCESVIGFVPIPVGVVGPVVIDDVSYHVRRKGGRGGEGGSGCGSGEEGGGGGGPRGCRGPERGRGEGGGGRGYTGWQIGRRGATEGRMGARGQEVIRGRQKGRCQERRTQ